VGGAQDYLLVKDADYKVRSMCVRYMRAFMWVQ
jgi:hypothetical protein